jgi:hypothetical protein
MIPKQDPPDSDLDRQRKVLALGDPDFFGGGSYSYSGSRVASTTPVKLKSAAMLVPNSSNASTTSDIQKQRELLGLGSVNSFGGSPMAEARAARQRSNR